MSPNTELADFLRSRRLRLEPPRVATPGRRRTRGLRREEVAERAGISTDWYVRLEQGRAVKPSQQTLEALARALQLDAQDNAHLRRLVGHGSGLTWQPEVVPAALRRIVDVLPHPAYVTGRRWDLLTWNAAAADVFCDFGAMPKAERNLLHFVFADARARSLFGPGWTEGARGMLAQFRATYDLWAGSQAFAELVDRLHRASPLFGKWWQEHDIRSPKSGRKTLHHPTRGVLHFDHASFQANDEPALKLVLYTPVVV
jgi:transcriptional regulator with XRE-family HTH domain